MRKLFLSFCLLPVWAYAQGGPPMVTDDPGTPGDSHWEINIASLYSSTRAQDILQAPYFDINYGWGEHIQLKVETGWTNLWDQAAKVQSGADTVLLGVKYRFLDEEQSGISVSIYPQFERRYFLSSRDAEIADPANQYVLPFEFAKTFGNWEINPEIGYHFQDTDFQELFYGVVIAYENVKPFEPLGEVHVNQSLNGAGRTTLLNLGLRYTIDPALILIAALGHTISNEREEQPELDAYLGIQLLR